MKKKSFKSRQPVSNSDSIIKEKPQTRNKWYWKGKQEVERQGKDSVMDERVSGGVIPHEVCLMLQPAVDRAR